MKNFKGFKYFCAGLLVGSIGITSVFAAGGIKSAVFNSNKVILDGKILDLGGQQMISVVKDGETNASNYMPVRGVLEAMGYTVDWDGSRKAVIVSSGGSNNIGITDPIPVVPTPTPTPTPTPQITESVAYYDWDGIILSLVPDYGALVGVKEYGSAGWGNNNNDGADPNLHVVEIAYPVGSEYDIQKYKEILIKDKFIKQEITSNTATLLGFANNLHNNAYDLYKKGDVSVAISPTNTNLVIFIVEPFDNPQINTVPTPTPMPQTNTYPFMDETYSFEFSYKIQQYNVNCSIDSFVFTKYENIKNGKMDVWFKANGLISFDDSKIENTTYRIFDSVPVDFVADCYNSSGTKIESVAFNLRGNSTAEGWRIDGVGKIKIPTDTVRIEIREK